MTQKSLAGLSAQIKQKLIQKALERKLGQSPEAEERPLATAGIAEEYCSFRQHPGFQQLLILNDGAKRLGVQNPYFKLHQGLAGATTRIGDRELINFASYNYLGLNGHPKVNQAAKAAIDRYGTSVSASRPVSGERPIHRQLEARLASAYGVDGAVVFVSGHATNVTCIGYLFGKQDLILHDELIHNSVVQGALLSGARRLSFPHNDWERLDKILEEQRSQFQRAVIVIEGIYSMDGDFPDLPRFIDIKRRHQCFLMVDEAHSFGVMGATGKGIREHFGIDGKDVDIWMGTLSKSLAGCGGFIAGEFALVDHLKFLAPGFLYSVGLAPPLAAASLAALGLIQEEPERVARLQANSRHFLAQAQAAGVDTGYSAGLAVVPAIIGSSLNAARLSERLQERGINVQPIVYPAVPEKAARLRFFLSSEHSMEQIEYSVDALAKELGAL